MKKLQIISLTLLALMVVSLSPFSPVQADYVDGVTDHCDTPTEFVTIIAAPSGDDTDLTFDEDEISVSENTCVEITFINNAPTVEHDFVIDSTPGDDGISFVDIHVANHTAGEYNNGTETFNIQTNNANTFTYYCSIGNHREAGMEGTLIVGDGSSSFLSFTPLVFIGLFSFVTLTLLRRKQN